MSRLSAAALNRAHILVITARSHALECRNNLQIDRDEAVACIDTLAKQLDLIEDVLAQNEGPLDDEDGAA